MPNRYKRDQLIANALDMSTAANLKHHDMPDGVVLPNAFSIQWIQDILDFWYHMCPFSATVIKTSLNATANSDTITLPSDFILDVRNGYLTRESPDNTNSLKRRYRLPLQKFITIALKHQGATNINTPFYYCPKGTVMLIAPTPTIATTGFLWYYQLPPALDADTVPKFPSDYIIIEYIRIRALEWIHKYEPGTAQKFCDKILGSMKAAGLMNEPEDDELPFDETKYINIGRQGVPSSWMGPV